MIDFLDPASARFLNALERISQGSERAHRQVSSGIRVSRPSDAPDAVSQVLQIQAALARVNQARKNLGSAKAEADTGESSLATAGRLLEKIAVLGAEGANGLDDAAKRSMLAEQVAALQEQLVGLASVTVEGRYIFGGDSDGEPPYRYDAAQLNGAQRLTGAPATRRVVTAGSAEFVAGATASEIFDPRDSQGGFASGNAFAAVAGLRRALESNSLTDVQSALSQVKAAENYIAGKLSFYGALQTRVNSAAGEAESMYARLTAQLSEKRDADIPAAVVELTRLGTQQDAVLQTQARFPRRSLFDYLK